MSTPYADLHMHTHCSDGRHAPAELVARAARTGVRAISVTDHDTVAGLAEAAETAEAHGLAFLSGVELSVTVDGEEVHLLAYGFDPAHEGLKAHLDRFLEARRDRVRRIVEALQQAGVGVTMDDVLVQAGADDAPETALPQALGRPHVAAALVEAGAVDAMQEAFDRYLGRGAPAFVSKPEMPAADVLAIVHDAGGIGSLAHPGHWTPSAQLRALVDAGLDAIEVVHPSHDASLRDYYLRAASSRGLLVTGGSDYHGTRPDDEARLGTYGLTQPSWERLQAALS